jgi:hypothetical protein
MFTLNNAKGSRFDSTKALPPKRSAAVLYILSNAKGGRQA